MNQSDIATIAKQHRQYRTEALAKRRNLADFSDSPRCRNTLVMATSLNEQTMLIIRTEAKAKAIEELAAELGIALEVG